MFPFLKNSASEQDGERGGKLHFWIILGGALLGIFLLLYGGGAFRSDGSGDSKKEEGTLAENELILYQAHLEERIRTLCESVAGVSNVTVFVTLERGYETVYATEEGEGGKEYVILGSGSSSNALPLAKEPPKVCGIGIVCRGGGNASVRRELTALLSAAFRLSSNRIYVTDTGG